MSNPNPPQHERDPDVLVEVYSHPRFLAPIRAMVTCLAERIGFDPTVASQISLAVDEAIANIINHGYKRRDDGRIWVYAWALEGDRAGLRFVLDDHGTQVDPTDIKSRDLDDIRPGGLGVHIIREVMDECRYECRTPDGMRLTLVKYLPEPSGDSPEPSSAPETLDARSSS